MLILLFNFYIDDQKLSYLLPSFNNCGNHETISIINAHHYIIHRIIQLQYMTSPLQDQMITIHPIRSKMIGLSYLETLAGS